MGASKDDQSLEALLGGAVAPPSFGGRLSDEHPPVPPCGRGDKCGEGEICYLSGCHRLPMPTPPKPKPAAPPESEDAPSGLQWAFALILLIALFGLLAVMFWPRPDPTPLCSQAPEWFPREDCRSG